MTNLIFRIIILFVALSVTSPLFAKLQSDDFNGSKLSSVWEIDNPKKAKWGVDGGELNVVGGINANVWGNIDATFFYQETDQKSFDVDTTVNGNLPRQKRKTDQRCVHCAKRDSFVRVNSCSRFKNNTICRSRVTSDCFVVHKIHRKRQGKLFSLDNYTQHVTSLVDDCVGHALRGFCPRF